MAIKESHIDTVDTDVVPKYEPSRPYPALEPSYEDIVIVLDEVEVVLAGTIYDQYPLGQTAARGPDYTDYTMYRITTDGDFRITDSGDYRVVA